jgi:long-chain acyl-CoA synthetase
MTAEWGAGKEFRDRTRQIRPGDLATIIYTSGTTGEPKGVMLTHANLVSNMKAGAEVLQLSQDDVSLSFLPLSHGFERMVAYIYLYAGLTVAFAESFDTIGRDIAAVRPTLMTGVPRVFEKLHARIMDKGLAEPGVKGKIFRWAIGAGEARGRAELRGRSAGLIVGFQAALADRLVFAKIRQNLGDRIRYLVSGSAPLSASIAEFFQGVGLPIIEGYGLTETAPILTVNPPGAPRVGTVGRAIPGVELRIAEDGEILARGPNIMRGYFNNEAATAEAIQNGWFHTGDIGVIDADGFLTITDRKKELIVNAYGKNVPPAKVEEALKSSRFIGQAVALGDKRKFIAALLVPNFDALRSWATSQGLSGSDAQLIEQNAVRELFAREVEGANERLAHYEEVRTWTLLPEEFSIEGGELTPTQKVKRRIVNTKYADVIDTMYSEADRRRG